MEEYATPKRNKHVLYQYFDMPWVSKTTHRVMDQHTGVVWCLIDKIDTSMLILLPLPLLRLSSCQPLGDREFLMERAVEADRRARTVVAKCESVV